MAAKRAIWLTAVFSLLGVLITGCGMRQETAVPPIKSPALVLFYTDGWFPWQQLQPIVDELDAEFGNDIQFYRLDANIQENETLQQSYGLRGHPTLVVLDKHGDISEKFVGEQSEETLRAALTAVLP